MPTRKPRLNHLDNRGAARMVNVGAKKVTRRTAAASALVTIKPAVLSQIMAGQVAKGDVLAVARTAGIMAAKKTADLIPLCHPLPIDQVKIDFQPEADDRLHILATVRLTARTGAEMEALTAAAVAALTVYDMCKSADRAMIIGPIRLESKTGGKSGTYRAPISPHS